MLNAALEYASRGWYVLPCHGVQRGMCMCVKNKTCRSPGKHPKTRNGVKDASIDRSVIEEWWEKWPNANVAIRTGRISDIWVLDLDADYDELVYGPYGQPLMIVQTGGGGKHLYYDYPESGTVWCRTGLGGQRIDVRGEDGYVIAPPSIHVRGQYRLVPGGTYKRSFI